MCDLKVGDVVKFKPNHGPPMTIEAIFGDGSAACLWFVGEHLRSRSFTLKHLELTNKPSGPR